MEKRKLNNEGFSLIELIIVIAIMAILVGALAPQLMKYLGRSRVSSDRQLADSVRTAVQVALADPNVTAPSAIPKTGDTAITIETLQSSADYDDTFKKAVADALGVANDAAGYKSVTARIKTVSANSANPRTITVRYNTSSTPNNVEVVITNVDVDSKASPAVTTITAD